MELLLVYTTADSTGSSSILPQSQESHCKWWAAALQCLGLVMGAALGAALLILPLEPAMVTHLQDEQLCSAQGMQQHMALWMQIGEHHESLTAFPLC